ncbi:MAG: hypothetical protein Q9222_005584 [Ikaeria aurantiellina]
MSQSCILALLVASVYIYGSVFRDAPNGLLFNTPEAHRAIYDNRANVKKGKFYSMYPRKAGAVNTWNCVGAQRHARKRRILNAAFSDKALRNSETYIIQHADRWCELLSDDTGSEWSSPRDMTAYSDALVFDILGELCYAQQYNIKEPGDNELKFLPKFMADYVMYLFKFARSPFRNVLLWLKPKGLDNLLEIASPKTAKVYSQFVRTCLAQRTKEERVIREKGMDTAGVRKDIFHHLFQAKDPQTGGPGYTEDELTEESDLLVVAGSDTTSTTFAAMFFYMTRNPAVYRKLISEIRTNFKNADDIRAGPLLTSCRYLRSFIDESLRMNPPVPGSLDREVLAGGMTIDGHFVREGTDVGVSLYSLQHNHEVFTNAFVFNPERWMVDENSAESAARVARYESAFAPFSIGPRSCPGKGLAYLEMSIAIAKALFFYDLRGLEGDELGAGNADLMWGRREKTHYQTFDMFVSYRHGPMVQFKSARE